MQTRLSVKKTYKLLIGGRFVRSESGRTLPAHSVAGAFLDNYAWASRKDLRDAVAAARAAQDGWDQTAAFLKGQVLYRAAEMLQSRAAELACELSRALDVSREVAGREVAGAVDRLVHFAGWTDKYPQVFGSVNPVATPHFNFTAPDPAGVVAVLAPDEPALLGLVGALAPVLLGGNTAVVLAGEKHPLPALTLGEALATSDLPAGAVNVLAGKRAELAPHIARHMDINAIVDATGDAALGAELQSGAALNLKRYAARRLAPDEWFASKAENPYWILDTVEFKTAWHPIGF